MSVLLRFGTEAERKEYRTQREAQQGTILGNRIDREFNSAVSIQDRLRQAIQQDLSTTNLSQGSRDDIADRMMDFIENRAYDVRISEGGGPEESEDEEEKKSSSESEEEKKSSSESEEEDEDDEIELVWSDRTTIKEIIAFEPRFKKGKVWLRIHYGKPEFKDNI